MAERRKSIHGEWSSHLAFILAASGSAVGLGNIWKFPYITGVNGGGAFVLVYLVCVAAIAVPIMVAEVMLGRRGRQSPINTMLTLAEESGRSRAWQALGWMGVIAGFLILSYYSVIAGWTLAYVFRTMAGAFTGADAEVTRGVFATFVSDPERLLAWHTIFITMTTFVVARGVRGGLEQAVRVLMPALVVLLFVLVGYAMNTGHFQEAVGYLFRPDFGQLTGAGVLAAMGQAFFSLSLGMGAIMIYGSYLSHTASIGRTVVTVAAADTGIAVLAGLAIFPIVFAFSLEPGAGPGLIFETLPIAFGQMWGGPFFGGLFFILLVFAAWTSAISLMEPAVAWLVETRGWRRIRAAVVTGLIGWVLGIGTVLSFNIWAGHTVFGLTFFELLDFLTSNVLLPLGGLLIAVFAAWRMAPQAVHDELAMGEGLAYRSWRFLVRYVAPLAVVVVFLNAIGVI
jgi:neurotransmitter:Na+ symporter, NSS family